MLQVRVHPFSEVFKYLKKQTVVKPVLSSTVLLTICLMLKLCASCGKSDYLKKWKIELSLWICTEFCIIFFGKYLFIPCNLDMRLHTSFRKLRTTPTSHELKLFLNINFVFSFTFIEKFFPHCSSKKMKSHFSQ